MRRETKFLVVLLFAIGTCYLMVFRTGRKVRNPEPKAPPVQPTEQPPERAATWTPVAVPQPAQPAQRAAPVVAQPAYVQQPPFMKRGEMKLNPEFIEHFKLGAGDAEQLQAAIDVAAARLDELSIAHAKVLSTQDTLRIEVRPFYGGADIYDELMDAFAASPLGREFPSTQYEIELDIYFGHFGAQRRTIEVKRVSPSRLVLTDDLESLELGGASDPREFDNVASLRGAIGNLVRLIPPGF